MYSRRELRLALATMVTMLAIMVAGALAATDYYVDKTGDNSDGLSWATAWHTVQQGIDSCSGTSADTVHVAAATYQMDTSLASSDASFWGEAAEDYEDE